MANVTNAEALRFINEEVRPMAERVQSMMARLEAMRTKWNATIGALIPNDVSLIVDNRQATEGVSQLTGANVVQIMAQFATIEAINKQIVAIPCVRPPQV